MPHETEHFSFHAPRGDQELWHQVANLRASIVQTLVSFDTDDSQSETPSRIANYEILGTLGSGGLGEVYHAQQPLPLQREVALKVIKFGTDTRAVLRRFDQERRILAQLQHPNIAQILDAGAVGDGRPFFVMELVRGAPLTKYCQNRNLPLESKLELSPAHFTRLLPPLGRWFRWTLTINS